MSRTFYELRRIRPYGLDSEELGRFGTIELARVAMDSWRSTTPQWTFRISAVTVEVVHDDLRCEVAKEQRP
jgi:hypothetical protein